MSARRDACQYGGCANTKKSRPAVAFFRFPTDDRRRADWVAGCGNAALLERTSQELHRLSVCEIHFTSDSFMRPGRDGRLIRSAVPSLDDHATVQTCCAFGCKEHHVKDGPVTFHSFPEDASLGDAWTRALGRANFSPDATSMICSRHFTPDCFPSSGVLRPGSRPTLFDFHDAILPDDGATYTTPEYLMEEFPPDIKEEPLDLDSRDPLGSSPSSPPVHEDSKDFALDAASPWQPPHRPPPPPTIIQTATQRFVVIPRPAGSDLPASLVFLPPGSPPAVVARVKRQKKLPVKPPTKKTPPVTSSTEGESEGPVLNMVFVKVEENWDDTDSTAEPRLSIVETTSLSDSDNARAMSWTMRLHPPGATAAGPTPPPGAQEATDSGGAKGEATGRAMDSRPSSPPADQSEADAESEPESIGAESEPEEAVPASSAGDPLDNPTPTDVPSMLVVGPLAPTEETIVQLQKLLLEERTKNATLEKRLEAERSAKAKLRRKLKATEQKLRRLHAKLVGMQLGRGVDTPAPSLLPAPGAEEEDDFA